MRGSFVNTSVTQNLRAHLHMSSSELPKIGIMDMQMWSAVKAALSSEDSAAELSWLNLGVRLSYLVRNANAETIGKLAEASVSSFITDIREDVFLKYFGRREDWKSLSCYAEILYYRARFASIYWCSVRDFAVKSKIDCLSVFHLPWSMIEVLAESTTSQIIDFCHGYPDLQQFKLTCPISDCELVIDRMQYAEGTSQTQQALLFAAKLLKSNHCACGQYGFHG